MAYLDRHFEKVLLFMSFDAINLINTVFLQYVCKLFKIMLLFVPTNVPISFFREYQLVVDVVDINDNAPSFGQPEYSFSVTEVCHVTINWRACKANGTDIRRNSILVSEASSTIYFAVQEWFECCVSIQDRLGKSYYLYPPPSAWSSV